MTGRLLLERKFGLLTNERRLPARALLQGVH